MDEIVIVGGGVAGLFAANILWNQGIAFRAIERGESLGSDLVTGHHRFYEAGAQTFFSSVGVGSEWRKVAEEPSELKGVLSVEPGEFSRAQRYFFGSEVFCSGAGVRRYLREAV